MKKMLLAIAFLGGVVSVNADQGDITKTYDGKDGRPVTFVFRDNARDIKYAGFRPYMVFCDPAKNPFSHVVAVSLKDYTVYLASDPADKKEACKDACNVQLNAIADFISKKVGTSKEDKWYTDFLLKDDGSVKYTFKFDEQNNKYSNSSRSSKGFCGIPRPRCSCSRTAL